MDANEQVDNIPSEGINGIQPKTFNFGLASIIFWVLHGGVLTFTAITSIMAEPRHVFLVLGFIFSVIGIIFGVLGMKYNMQKNKALALSGLILNFMIFPFWLLGMIEVIF